jgi:hypothetical protein
MPLPEMEYPPEYLLQPADPPTCPSSENSAVTVVLGTGAAPFKLSKIQTLPVIPPSAWDPVEAQAAKDNKAANPATISIVFFIVVILSNNPTFYQHRN